MKVRYLSKKEAKEVAEAAKALGIDFVPERAIEVGDGTEVLVGPGIFVKLKDGSVFPSLFDKRAMLLPNVAVDDGARPHVLNGANVMRPGIVAMDSSIKKGSLVLVKAGQEPLAIGVSLYDYAEAISMSKGVIVKNMHWKGDRAWDLVAEMLRKKPDNKI